MVPTPSPALLRALRSTETIRCTTSFPHNLRIPHASIRPPCRHPSLLSRSLSTTSHFRHPPPPTVPSPTSSNLESPTPSSAPSSTARGPPSTESTQTDFSAMDIFTNTPAPTNSIDACLSDGFHLDNGVKISGGDGLLLVGGEAFTWRPWEAASGEGRGGERLTNKKGQWEVGEMGWGVLGAVWPKPGM